MPLLRLSPPGSRPVLSVLALLSLLLPVAIRAGECAPLPATEADAVIERLLGRQEELQRVRAVVETTKEGGAFRTARTSRGLLRAAYPDRVLFSSLPAADADADAPEDPGFVLIDGQYLWEAQPQAPERPQLVERRTLETGEGGAASLGDLATFLLGVEITSAAELRQEFDVTVTPATTPEGAPAWHLLLRPRAEAESRTIEIWVAEGEPLPWRTRLTSRTVVYRPGVPPAERPVRESVETTVLRDVATNLSGLGSFPPGTFLFPLRPDMTVVDEAGTEIPPERLRADLDRVRARLAGSATAPRGPDATEAEAWE